MRFCRLIAVLAFALSFVSCTPEKAGVRMLGEVDGVPFYEMTAERLPDLPEARGSHHTMLLGDELTVFGGATDGFVMEPSIAYLKNGVWNKVPMKYPHYYGFATLLPDGKVMLGGGSDENFGIGQSWGVEIYDPQTHETQGVGIMSRKRAGVSAAVLSDGRVVVSGNWYGDDDIEIYEPGNGFSFVKESALQRAYPVILPSAPDNALIFSGEGTFGEVKEGIVDRLVGEPFHVPLLDEWRALYSINPTSSDDMRIGEYTYLLQVHRRADGQAAILKVAGEQFSLLETDYPIPMQNPDGTQITWLSDLQVDRSSRLAWIQGVDGENHSYAASIDYDPTFEGGKASIRVFQSGKDYNRPITSIARLLPGGKLAYVGGVKRLPDITADNFSSTSEVWVFHTAAEPRKAIPAWKWILALFTFGAAVYWLTYAFRQQKKAKAAEEAEKLRAAEEAEKTQAAAKTDLLTRIISLVEEKQLYLQKDLKVSDIARELGTNATYISASINGQMGVSFPDFISKYRVEHAQRLMREHPDMPLSAIWENSGFNNEKSFSRSFKTHTGQTPSAWKTQK